MIIVLYDVWVGVREIKCGKSNEHDLRILVFTLHLRKERRWIKKYVPIPREKAVLFPSNLQFTYRLDSKILYLSTTKVFSNKWQLLIPPQ